MATYIPVFTSMIAALAAIAVAIIQALANKKQDKRETARQKNELLISKSVEASLSLAIATAKAVKRIPDAKCNGDMDSALRNAQDAKREHRAFLQEQGIKSIYE